MKKYDEEFKRAVIKRFRGGETMAALVPGEDGMEGSNETGQENLLEWRDEKNI